MPLVLAVPPEPPEPPVAPLLAPPVPLFPLVLRWDRDLGEDDNGAGAWLACTAAAALDCWLVGEAETLWPSSDTTYRPPAVAAAAPSTHAPAPMTMRVRMLSESRMLR